MAKREVRAEVFKRSDGTYAWHAVAANHQVVAGDQGQGYVDQAEADEMMRRVLGGEFAGAVGRSVPQDPGVATMADWAVEALRLVLADARLDEAAFDLAGAAVADRIHTALWPDAWEDA
jgi:uncharacterized protein YegP (UPF0339 family)